MKKWTTLFSLLLLFNSFGYGGIMRDRLMLNQLAYSIRDPQTEPYAFRKALEKMGEYLALEVLQDMQKKSVEIETLTGGVAEHHLLSEDLALVTILRGGIPLMMGMQEVFRNAPVGFLGMARNEQTLKATTSYVALPNLKGKTVILADTMLATGGSMLDAIRLIEKEQPEKIYVVCAIAAREGIERVKNYNPQIKIYPAAVDPILNEKGYIVPGLGDAGDRLYGPKHEH